MLSEDRLRDFSGSIAVISFSKSLSPKYHCILVVTRDGSGWQKDVRYSRRLMPNRGLEGERRQIGCSSEPMPVRQRTRAPVLRTHSSVPVAKRTSAISGIHC
jgi:hypothetical protein